MEDNNAENNNENPEVNAVRVVKIPPFWRENPSLWFMQVEAAFAISRITADTTKYRYVLVNLDSSTLPFVSDILSAPPAINAYDALKERLISSFDETSESKLRRLLRGTEISEEKPSNLLQRLRNLAGSSFPENVLRSLFLEHLPEQIRGILAISEVTDLTKLATQADKIIDLSRPSILAVETTKPSCSKPDPSGLEAQVNALTKEIKDLRSKLANNRGRSSSRTRKNPKQTYCYFHMRFGDKARNCREPCDFQLNKTTLNH